MLPNGARESEPAGSEVQRQHCLGGNLGMPGMTPRQRVQAALDHEEPDCVPLDLGTGGNSAPVPELY